MRALAVDTSTHRGQVALVEDGSCVARQEGLEPGRHAESLVGWIDRCLAEAGWSKATIDVLVCGLGPGSFTGVRVAVATVKGMALGLDRPVVGVCGLEVMASSARAALGRSATSIVTLLDARKGEVYWAHYRAGEEGTHVLTRPLHAPAGAPDAALVTAAVAPGAIVVGEIASRIDLPATAAVYRSPSTDLPDAVELARAGERRVLRDGSDDLAALEPIYVRPPDITRPRTMEH